MAKKKKKRPPRRAYLSIATTKVVPWGPSLLRPVPYPLPTTYDRRTFHPLGKLRPAATSLGKRHQLKTLKKPAPLSKIGFANPRHVLVCIRRNQRKQVLHAINKTGKAGQRRPRRNEYSEISCR